MRRKHDEHLPHLLAPLTCIKQATAQVWAAYIRAYSHLDDSMEYKNKYKKNERKCEGNVLINCMKFT